MERLGYILDTNGVADYIYGNPTLRMRLRTVYQNQHNLYLCQPVHFEVIRGLLRTNAVRKRAIFEQQFTPLLTWVELQDENWWQAARFWVQTTSTGKQLSDVDLLISALAVRLGAVIVSNDHDFDALPVRRENWRV